VVPFFVGDGIKIVVAAMIGPKLRQQYLVMSEDG
jgi:biotin transporter BioY